MKKHNFILPVTALQKLEDIIRAYYIVKNSVTSTELSRFTNNQIISKDIAGSTTFLRTLGIITRTKGYRYHLTEFGEKFGEAIDQERDAEISACWEAVIDNTEFLREIYTGLQIVKLLRQSELMAQIYSKAGRQPSGKTSGVHARTILYILEKSKHLRRTKQGNTVFYSINESKYKNAFINEDRIDSLIVMNTGNKDFDLSKLIQLCRELNFSYENKNFYATGLLIRSILNHVPPILGQRTFKEVASNYGGSKSFKENMQSLESFSRKIADGYAHDVIKRRESLPNPNQVNFSAPLDILLQKIIEILEANRLMK